MTAPLIVKNARIIDPDTGIETNGALRAENGAIADIISGALDHTPDNATIIDAKGQVLAPGLIDTRVFIGEPGHEYRETLKSAGEAAVAGGVTSLVSMPDTQPVLDDHAMVDFIKRRADADSPARILPSAAITKGLDGTELTEFGLLKQAGAVALTEGRKSIQSAGLMKAAMLYARNFDLQIIHHVVDYALRADGVMNDGLFATSLGLKGIPSIAETVPLSRDLQIAAFTQARYHAAQISTTASARLMAEAKQAQNNVTAGISINNLTLNELDVGSYRTFFKLSPPLRTEGDRQAMVDAVKSGAIDIIHSAHDPQDVEVKRQPFADAATGAIGLETLLAASLRLVHDGSIPLATILKCLTINPARLLNIPQGRITKGAPADLILIDLDYPWVNEENKIRSRSKNTAFEGARFTGKVMKTFVGGKCVFEQAE